MSSDVVAEPETHPGAFEPPELVLKAEAGTRARASLTVHNRHEKQFATTFKGSAEFRESGALARGIREGFAKTQGDVIHRLIRLGEHLQKAQTLSIDFQISAEGKIIEANESLVFNIEFVVPKSAKAGSWSTRLRLFDEDLPVTFKLSKAAKSKAPAKTKHPSGGEP